MGVVPNVHVAGVTLETHILYLVFPHKCCLFMWQMRISVRCSGSPTTFLGGLGVRKGMTFFSNGDKATVFSMRHGIRFNKKEGTVLGTMKAIYGLDEKSMHDDEDTNEITSYACTFHDDYPKGMESYCVQMDLDGKKYIYLENELKKVLKRSRDDFGTGAAAAPPPPPPNDSPMDEGGKDLAMCKNIPYKGKTFMPSVERFSFVRKRPDVPLDILKDVEFQITDIQCKELPKFDSKMSESDPFIYLNPPLPVEKVEEDYGSFEVYIYGCMADGSSVELTAEGFFPYMFVETGDQILTDDQCVAFKNHINKKIQCFSPYGGGRGGGYKRPKKEETFLHNPNLEVMHIERTANSKSIQGYRENTQNFVKIVCKNPETVDKIEKWFAPTNPNTHVPLDMPDVFNGKKSVSMRNSTYETKVDYKMRLNAAGITPGGWVKVPAGEFCNVRPEMLDSTCCYEAKCDWESVGPSTKEGMAPLRILSFDIECAPKKGHRGFPNAEDGDPCIQIGSVCYQNGTPDPILSHIVTCGKTDPIEGVVVEDYSTEREMLIGFRDLVAGVDPDMIIGFNINKFDWKYLAHRARILGVDGFFRLGRKWGQLCKFNMATFDSKARGLRDDSIIPTPGRMQMDIHVVYKNERTRENLYSLNALSAKYLKDAKLDVSPEQITSKWYSGDPAQRAEVASYCVKDCELPYRLMMCQDFLQQYMEMSCVTGVTMNDLSSRGQQVKVFTLLVKECSRKDAPFRFIIPTVVPDKYVPFNTAKKKVKGKKYTGAVVIDPEPGVYSDPIITLDFESLYPSIMMAHNLSYEMLLSPTQPDPKNLGVDAIKVDMQNTYEGACQWDVGGRTISINAIDESLGDIIMVGDRVAFSSSEQTLLKNPKDGKYEVYTVTEVDPFEIKVDKPVGPLTRARNKTTCYFKVLREKTFRFVQHDPERPETEGIMARICRILFSERKKAKNEMRDANDAGDNSRARIYNARQLALKISVNSVYGFAGAVAAGRLPCIEIASSVTAIGRDMIYLTKKVVEEYAKTHDAHVIYGDTDSVMIGVDVSHYSNDHDALEFAISLGGELAGEVNKHFKKPINLQFEKVYKPYILYKKKRYIGGLWTNPDERDCVDMKGLQTVRRDTTPYTKKIMRECIDVMVTDITEEDIDKEKEHVDNEKKFFREQMDTTTGPTKRTWSECLEALGDTEEMNAGGALERKMARIVKKASMDLVEGRVEEKDLYMTFGLNTKKLDEGSSQANVNLVSRIKKRAPGTEPAVGDRWNVVCVQEAPHMEAKKDRYNSQASAYERWETPEWIRQCNEANPGGKDHKKPYYRWDMRYYMEKQLENPLCDLLEPFGGQQKNLFLASKQILKKQEEGIRRKNLRFVTGQRTLAAFMAPKAKPTQ
jgi:DNA polymerase elongation subunit (family B)